VDAIDQAGIDHLAANRKIIKVLKTIRFEHGTSWAELKPRDRGFAVDVEIDFPTPLIGRQRRNVEISPTTFRNDIAQARTFGFMKDVEYLWKKNLALGASLENTVALGDDRILNPEGLRFPDEFVRHKILDAVGDLSLAGHALQATYTAYCPGHKINAMMLERLFADPTSYTVIEATSSPLRRDLGRGDIGMSLPAFAAERS